jgi:acetyl-CoA synthetase
VLVELLGDAASVILTASRAAITRALRALCVFPLLQGYRGRSKGDLEGAVAAIEAMAAFAQAHCDDLVEVEVNPLLVLREGFGAVAVDALMRIGAPVRGQK